MRVAQRLLGLLGQRECSEDSWGCCRIRAAQRLLRLILFVMLRSAEAVTSAKTLRIFSRFLVFASVRSDAKGLG
jgi:hypothetical protein